MQRWAEDLFIPLLSTIDFNLLVTAEDLISYLPTSGYINTGYRILQHVQYASSL